MGKTENFQRLIPKTDAYVRMAELHAVKPSVAYIGKEKAHRNVACSSDLSKELYRNLLHLMFSWF